MTATLFANLAGLDVEFLESAYGDDAETAAGIFEDYLNDYASNLQKLKECFHSRQVEEFRHLLHKQKPSFTYVGLSDVTNTFQQLYDNCHTVADLDQHAPEIEKLFQRIESTAPLLERTLETLRNA